MIDVVLLCVAALLALAVLACLTARTPAGRILIYGGSLIVCVVLLELGFIALNAGIQRATLPIGLPFTGAHVRLDALSAAFLMIIGLGGAGASLFAIGYGKHEPEPQRVLPFYPAFLAGMTLVTVADDAFLFLFAWELMSLSSWALVMAQHREPGNARAGYIYILMATFSGLTLLLAFGMLAAGQGGGYAFDAMRASHPSPYSAALVFILVLIGAGSKSGLVPLHVWLPLAHPAAPSHVSALMSGVMTKIAVYAFIRIVFDLLGGAPWWAATIVLALGGITAVLGVLHAMMERDLKRLLAYSTVENIGIIFVGLGLAMAFQANAFTAGAALALTAALFHALNHTAFKSLLFFGAGAVLHATGERDMEKLGGLIHRMPRTAFAVLFGCIAISALPPLNGFVSEWLTFQAVLLRPELPQWGLKIMIPVNGALLALAAALAAACFVRAYGITFLVTQTLVGGRMPVQLSDQWLTISPIAASRSSYNGLLVFAFIAMSAILVVLAIHRLATRAKRSGPAWDCGFPDPSPATQYTGTSFAQPIRRVYGTTVFRTREVVHMPPPGETSAATIERHSHDLIWEWFYAPVAWLIARAADKLNVLQFLTIRRYLGFVFGALIVLLLALALWQ